jgi:hypothetical protein
MQLRAPVESEVIDVYSQRFSVDDSGQPQMKPPLPIECSLSDPFVALTVESHGCDIWFPYVAGQQTPEPQLLSSDRQLLLMNNVHGSHQAFSLGARCIAVFDNPIDIGLGVQVGSSGIDQVELSGFDDVPQEILPMPSGQFLGIGKKTVAVLARNGQRWVRPAGVGVTVDGTPKVYTLNDFIVVKDVCDDFACAAPNQAIYAWEMGSGKLGLRGFPGGVQLIGRLAANRLAFYHPDTLGTSGEVLLVSDVLDADKPLALTAPAFPWSSGSIPGVSHSPGLVYIGQNPLDGHFQRVEIDAVQETVVETDLGTIDGLNIAGTLMNADASSFFYWGKRVDGSCTLGLHDGKSAATTWSQSTCLDESNAPLVLTSGTSTLFVALLPDKLLALDSASGQTVWSWSRVLRPGVRPEVTIPVKGMSSSGSSLIVTIDSPNPGFTPPDVRVIGFDGTGKLWMPLQYFAAQEGQHTRFLPLIDSSAPSGKLVALEAGAMIEITTADADLNAPATLCSRTDCGAGSVDLASDAQNCGGCGKVCPADQSCFEGSCGDTPFLL